MWDEAGRGLRVRLFGPLMISMDGSALPRTDDTRHKISRPVQWLLTLLLLAEGEERTYAAIQRSLWPFDAENRSVRDAASKLRQLIETDPGGTEEFVTARTSGRDRKISQYVLRDRYANEVLRLWNPAKSSIQLTLTQRDAVDALYFADNIHSQDAETVLRLYQDSSTCDLIFEGCATDFAEGVRKNYEKERASLWQRYHELTTASERVLAIQTGHLSSRLGEASHTNAPADKEERREIPRHDLSLLEVPTGLPTTMTLPAPISSFFGRGRDVQELTDLLLRTDVRLVTVTGLGGWGKTRLALAAAHACADPARRVFQETHFCDFAVTDNVSDIYARVAERIGSTEPPSVPAFEQLVNLLQGKRVLLLLDNLESLSPKGGPYIKQMLTRLPGVTCLVTSRLDLGLGGLERRYPVEPLELPADVEAGAEVSIGSRLWESLRSNGCIKLFVDRAKAADPGFVLSPNNVTAVAGLCRRLDGIPLAIELAAAWANIHTPAEMLSGMANADLLVSHQDNDDPRQKSLFAVMNWSFELLEPREQQLFAAISVFPNDFNFGAAAAVGREPNARECLYQLQRHSLITAESTGEETRYRLLGTLREFAERHLDEHRRETAASSHAAYFLGFAEAMKPHLTGPGQAGWLARGELEHDNLRAAVRWFEQHAEGSGEGGLWRMAAALWRYWWVRGFLEEGSRTLDGVLARHVSLEHAGLKAKVLNGAGVLAWRQGRISEALGFFEECQVVAESVGDAESTAASLQNSVGLLAQQGDMPTARIYLERSLKKFRELNDRGAEAVALMNWGNLDLYSGHHEDAEKHYDESLVLLRELGDDRNIILIQLNRAVLANQRADYDKAVALLREGVKLLWKVGDKTEIAEPLEALAFSFAGRKDHRRLAIVLGMGSRWRQETGSARSPQVEEGQKIMTVAATEGLGTDFEPLWKEGYACTMEQIVESIVSGSV